MPKNTKTKKLLKILRADGEPPNIDQFNSVNTEYILAHCHTKCTDPENDLVLLSCILLRRFAYKWETAQKLLSALIPNSEIKIHGSNRKPLIRTLTFVTQSAHVLDKNTDLQQQCLIALIGLTEEYIADNFREGRTDSLECAFDLDNLLQSVYFAGGDYKRFYAKLDMTDRLNLALTSRVERFISSLLPDGRYPGDKTQNC